MVRPPPKATIALAVATCIPFGLAIRDTAAGKYEVDSLAHYGGLDEDDDEDEDLDEDEDYREVAERHALEEIENRKAIADYEARKAVERAERTARIASMYSSEVAMQGSAFEHVHLGDPVGKVTIESTPDAYLSLFDDGATTHGLHIQLHRFNDGDCEHLAKGIRAAWGEPKARYNRWIWVNESARQRAIWTEADCELVFERLASVEDWIGTSESSLIPLWAIGKPAKQVLAALGDRGGEQLADDQLSWPVRSFGVGRGTAQVVADVRRGKVTSLFVSLEIDGTTLGTLSERISTLVGKDPEIPNDRPDTEIWKTTPRIELVEGAPQTFLTIGTRPE